MTTTASPAPGPPPVEGLRERKKRETRLALHRAALELVDEHGLAAVTTDEIAARADVSPRTFFNYFPSKDAAVLGSGPEDLEQLRTLVLGRPPDEEPLEVMRHVTRALLAPAGLDPKLRRLRRRVLLAERDLAPALVGRNIRVENALTAALESRMGVDPGRDVRPRVLAATVLAAARACMEHHQQGGRGSVEDSMDQAFDLMAAGLS